MAAAASSLTSQQEEQEQIVPAHAQPSLEWLINPISTDDFFKNYWEKKPLVVRRKQRRYFSELLSLAEVDRVITTLDRRYPEIVLKNANREITDADYTVRGGRLDVAKVYQLFQEGSTIALSFLDTIVPSLTLFCRALESEFSHPFQTNVYLTPPGAQGAKPHYDTHDVFVMQAAGTKEWSIYGTPVELPLPGQDFDASVHQLGSRTLDFVLEAGDVAYIPRGVVHDARATDVVSLHITAGILRYTWTDLLLEMVAYAGLNDAPCAKRFLPDLPGRSSIERQPGRRCKTCFGGSRKCRTLRRLSSALSMNSYLRGSPVLIGQMPQMAQLDRLTIVGMAGARPGLSYRLQVERDCCSIDCYGRRITFPSHALEAVRFILSHSRFAIRDLPGALDDSAKVTLVRRLIREGLAVALAHEEAVDPGAR